MVPNGFIVNLHAMVIRASPVVPNASLVVVNGCPIILQGDKTLQRSGGWVCVLDNAFQNDKDHKQHKLVGLHTLVGQGINLKLDPRISVLCLV